MTKQFPRNGLEFAQFTDEGRGTFGVYKNKVRYTDKASGRSKDITCKNADDAVFQANFFKRSWEAKKAKEIANNC